MEYIPRRATMKITYVERIVAGMPAHELEQVKKLCRRSTGETFKAFLKHTCIVGYRGGKAVSMCVVSRTSPNKHFDNETNGQIVPYLYNFICDYKYKKNRISLDLMTYVKGYIAAMYGGASPINLDVEVENINAQNFFIKNGFVESTRYIVGDNKEYIGFTLRAPCSI